MLELIQSLLSAEKLAIILPVLVAVNVILSGVGMLLDAVKAKSASSAVGKVVSGLKWLLDLMQGNLAHK